MTNTEILWEPGQIVAQKSKKSIRAAEAPNLQQNYFAHRKRPSSYLSSNKRRRWKIISSSRHGMEWMVWTTRQDDEAAFSYGNIILALQSRHHPHNASWRTNDATRLALWTSSGETWRQMAKRLGNVKEVKQEAYELLEPFDDYRIINFDATQIFSPFSFKKKKWS